MTTPPKPKSRKAIDACPNARLVHHHATSVINYAGNCPDCGRQIAPLRRVGRPGKLAALRQYEGSGT